MICVIESVTDPGNVLRMHIDYSGLLQAGHLVIYKNENKMIRDWFSNNDFNEVHLDDLTDFKPMVLKRDRAKFVIILKDCIKIPIDNEL